MEGSIYFESKEDGSIASHSFKEEKDFTSGNYEASLAEVFIPNTAHIEIPEEAVNCLWVIKKEGNGRGNQLGGWIKARAERSGRRCSELKTTDKYTILIEHLGKAGEFIEKVNLPSFTASSVTHVVSYLNNFITNVGWKDRHDEKFPLLRYERGYVHIDPGYPWPNASHNTFNIPIFGPKLSRILGLNCETNPDFLENVCTRIDQFLAGDVNKISPLTAADLQEGKYYQEVHGSFIESIFPGEQFMEERILRILPLRKSNIGGLIHYKFQPVYYKMISERVKNMTITLKDSDGIKADVRFGKSLFKVQIRKRNE